MPTDSVAAAELLARLLTDDGFRAEFRRDPAGTAREMDLGELAEELDHERERAFQTLEVRESRSSLAGVLLAAAAEGVGVAELVHGLRGGEGERWQAAAALSMAMPAARHAGAVVPADLPVSGDAPPGPLSLLKDPHAAPSMARCHSCGGPAPLGSALCPVCRSEGRSAIPARAPASARSLSVSYTPPAPSGQVADAAPAPSGQVADALPAPAVGAGAAAPTVQPIDPSLLDNTNVGGRLHGSEFDVRDAEGAPGPGGTFHAGYDFFARENAPIRSPVAGTVVEVRASRGTSGQIFGGTVKVQGADGKVWVFRHVTPGAVRVGEQVPAGTQIAAVSPWTDGPEHTHIEVWKSLRGGYEVSNMEDPLPYLQHLYPAAGAPPPVSVGAPVLPDPSAPPVPAPVGAVAAVPPPVAAAPATAAEVLASPNVSVAPAVQGELASPDLDPRALPVLSHLAGRYEIGVTSVESGDGLSRIVISSVNGKPVGPTNVAARDLAQELAALDPSTRPSDVGTPWHIRGQGFFTDPEMRNRIEITHRAGDAPAPVGAPAPAAAPPPAPVAAPPPVPAASPTPVGAPAPAAVPAAVPAAAVAPEPAAAPAAAGTPPAVGAPPADPRAPGAGLAADAAASLPPGDAALAGNIDAWIARKNPGSPLEGFGASFVREGRANGVDPRLLVAIARAESSLGTDPGARSIHNAFGWGPAHPFPTWDANIATVAKGLKTGYLDQGLDTIDKIQKRYCPVGAANDSRGVNANWLGNVRLLYQELGGNPDGSVAVPSSGQGAAPVSDVLADPSVAPAPVPVAAAVPAPAPAPPAVAPSAPAPAPVPVAAADGPPSAGRASAVFHAVPDARSPAQGPADDGVIARPNTARSLPAAPDPRAAAPAPAAVPGTPAAPVAPTSPAAPGAPAPVATPAEQAVQPAGGDGHGAALLEPLALPGGGNRGEQIASIAKAELGVREQSMGSNDGPRIAEYRTATAGSGVGPWCAYFTSWVAKKAGVPVGPGGTGIGYVPTMKNWAEQTDRWIPSGSAPPQVGDLVVFDHQGDGIMDHIGVVTGTTPDGGISTVEGNSGDQVASHSYGPDGYAGLVRLVAPNTPALPDPSHAVAMAAVPAPAAVAAPAPAPVPAAFAASATPAAPAVAAAPPAAAAAAAADTPPSQGRASAVFHAAPAPAADREPFIARPNTARALPAAPAPDPTAAPPAAAPADAAAAPSSPAAAPPADQLPPAAPAPAGGLGLLEPYPGDAAPKEAVAAWMAQQAQAAGLPPELPVMAALVESGLTNLDHGDADSLGFFQMRTSAWDNGAYAGYANRPELQVKWFIDQALAIKQKRLQEGLSSFGTDPSGYGEWIADVERPAEIYRGRYQERLDQARALLAAGGGR